MAQPGAGSTAGTGSSVGTSTTHTTGSTAGTGGSIGASRTQSTPPLRNIPNEKPQISQTPASNAGATTQPRERVKKKAPGHVISEEVSDKKEESDLKMKTVISAGTVATGAAMTVGGIIAGSTPFTVIGFAVIGVGGAYYLFGGD